MRCTPTSSSLTAPSPLHSDYEFLSSAFTEFNPTAAVHFGEQRRCAAALPW